jgi:proteasome lid subunit RPN8/RPN11
LLDSDEIVAIVHSHPRDSAEPSPADINACNTLMIPYLIISAVDSSYVLLHPEKP